jgi:paraquat-inducible protein A
MRWVAHGLDKPVALALTAALTFLIANLFPVMTLEFQALRMDASMVASVWQLHEQGETLVGLLVLVTAVIAPATLILLLLWLLLPLRLGFRAPAFAPLFRLLMAVSDWAMVEVLMLGVVVALVKLGHLATASAGIGLWAYGVTMLLLTLLSSSLQGDVIWSHHENVMRQLKQPAQPDGNGEIAEVRP